MITNGYTPYILRTLSASSQSTSPGNTLHSQARWSHRRLVRWPPLYLYSEEDFGIRHIHADRQPARHIRRLESLTTRARLLSAKKTAQDGWSLLAAEVADLIPYQGTLQSAFGASSPSYILRSKHKPSPSQVPKVPNMSGVAYVLEYRTVSYTKPVEDVRHLQCKARRLT